MTCKGCSGPSCYLSLGKKRHINVIVFVFNLIKLLLFKKSQISSCLLSFPSPFVTLLTVLTFFLLFFHPSSFSPPFLHFTFSPHSSTLSSLNMFNSLIFPALVLQSPSLFLHLSVLLLFLNKTTL